MKQIDMRLDDYLEHILQAIERIEEYTSGLSEDTFLRNTLVQDAVIRNFEIMGEACRNIQRRYPEFETDYADFPLSAMYGMRNVLAHGYFEVDLELVWRVIMKNLPSVKQSVSTLRSANALS